MSLIPEFEIGIWNAWIFIIPLIFFWICGVKFVFSKRMPDFTPPSNKGDKILSNLEIILMFGSFIYSIFITLKLGTIWFSSGLIIYLAGLFLIALTMINFVTTPVNKPVIIGIYRYSRNPMFIGWFLLYFGISIACISWVYILITVLFMIFAYYLIPFEEEITLNYYGKPYQEYMDKTPRWIGIPKSQKTK